MVEWHRLLWFPQAIPRQRFITWLAFRNKLSTGSRMRQWGMTQACPLCGEPNETRDHLYNTLIQYGTCSARALSPLDSMLSKLAFQATIYWIWKERNGRCHDQPRRTPMHLAHVIHKEISNKLLSLGDDAAEVNERLLRWNEVATLH
ncbi:unnamed protein product [Arabis nemorensis]|uniref:Reverse transcriptase zinc-binding domain-containing protein n=1 Tax=Arabis nemorensis TaxID=586526 RepID=A0A565BU34_9BRAS|nr:unnamed protein product [Arabis nemorensis]